LYGGTLALLRDLLPRYGVPVRFVSDSEARDPDAALAEGARVVYLESPTNPRLGVHDLARWARAADEAGALMVVDNTFATPINQRPLELGADLVIHSGTKYLGGHADLLAGVVVGARGLVDRLDATHSVLGSVLDPLAAFLLARGLRTLELRMDRHNRNGAQVAEALAQHPKVRAVHYPGRGSAEEEKVVARQMRGRGGMVAVEVEGGVAGAHRFLRRLRFIHPASSLGGVESLASIPAETSHRHLTPEQLADRGIAPGLVRLSLGIENGDDLVRDLSESLDAL
ncbi:MAG TPA: PLP-dependent transferase, partial [Thermoplasmata archaeon]|nr:PLP-dependent transferase [Thermoplasmata archaeon]